MYAPQEHHQQDLCRKQEGLERCFSVLEGQHYLFAPGRNPSGNHHPFLHVAGHPVWLPGGSSDNFLVAGDSFGNFLAVASVAGCGFGNSLAVVSVAGDSFGNSLAVAPVDWRSSVKYLAAAPVVEGSFGNFPTVAGGSFGNSLAVVGDNLGNSLPVVGDNFGNSLPVVGDSFGNYPVVARSLGCCKDGFAQICLDFYVFGCQIVSEVALG